MQTCAKCQTQSPDEATHCGHCGADLGEFSTTVVALRRLQSNPRVTTIRVVVAHDACPACQAMEGTYAKELAPTLPVRGCSHALGCRCFYQPFLAEIFP